jgi:hypothetical protein
VARPLWRRLLRRRPGDIRRRFRRPPRPLDQVRSLEQLSPDPLVYERAAFMEHIRRYDREALREYYSRQPGPGARVWANYAVNLWEYEHGAEELTSYPWNITIPMTEVCNARCTFCSSPLVPDPKALATHEVRHFADALRHAVFVSLQGLGEPLAHPHFEEIAAELGKYLSPVARLDIITNGWLLSGHRWALLKSLGINAIQVSVNAATDRTHQVAMGSRPGTFDQVVKNIAHVLADLDWSGFLKASMVVTRHSLPEVPQFLDLFVSKGVRVFQFNALLPLVTSDWGFGRGDQYVDLWCGHLGNAPDLVERAAAAIVAYRARGIRITATPEQWLLPVTPERSSPVRLSLDQQNTAVFQVGSAPSPTADKQGPETFCVWVDDRRLVLAPHEKHADVTATDEEGLRFLGTPQSCRWAYLLQSSDWLLAPGQYTLDLGIDVSSGHLYAGILDVEKDEFVIQAALGSSPTRIDFALAQKRLIGIVVRQGADDTPVRAIYRYGKLSTSSGLQVPGPQHTAGESVKVNPASEAAQQPRESVDRTRRSLGLSKPGRIYCPMVYTTLSVFHHSLSVSVCCYMENAPGQRQPNLKDTTVLRAYNDDGFKLVRQTLNTDRHIPVCDSCPFGASRS